MRKIAFLSFVGALASASCTFQQKVTTAERLNNIYETEFFDLNWKVAYESELTDSTCYYFHVFDVNGLPPNGSYLADDKDATFEEYYACYLDEILKRQTLDENYLPHLNKPYEWCWRYLWDGVFSYADTRDPDHVKANHLGSIMAVYSEENGLVYTIEKDYH